jgi:rhodanese-related sulfurtransferase
MSKTRAKSKARKSTPIESKWIIALAGLLGIIVLLVAALVLNGDDDTAEGVIVADGVVQPGLIQPQQYLDQFVNAEAEHLLIDVRTPEEFESGHIPGAINIPVQVIDQYLDQIPQDEPIVLYCRSGNRSSQAFDILSNSGYSDIYDLGGIIDWTARGLPVE